MNLATLKIDDRVVYLPRHSAGTIEQVGLRRTRSSEHIFYVVRLDDPLPMHASQNGRITAGGRQLMPFDEWVARGFAGDR